MNKLNSKRSIIFSVTALLLIFVLIVGIAFSWTESGTKGSVDSSEIVISSGSKLTIQTDAGNSDQIEIDTDELQLAEVSSADGRNFFFPTAYNTSKETDEMVFREGIPADENTKYLSFDFDLQSSGTGVQVYLGSGTIVRCANQSIMNALRVAIFENDGSVEPIAVFRPNQMAGTEDSFSPIAALTTDFKADLVDSPVSTEPFGDFYYGNTKNQSLFTLEGGEVKHLTVALWLEGTEFGIGEDEVVNYSDFDDYKVSLNLDFTTNADALVKYNFVDNTRGYVTGELESWVTETNTGDDSGYTTMMYVYDKSNDRYYAMTKTSDYWENKQTELSSWSIYIPDTIKAFTFRRYSIDIDNWWNEWNPSMTDIKTDSNGEHTFVAICGSKGEIQAEKNTGCYGYWKDTNGKMRLYFQKESYWENLHCYAWVPDGTDSNTDADPSKSTDKWPGKSMTFVKNINDDNGKPLYYVDLDETENIQGVQFNNGVSTEIYFSADFGYTHVYAYDSNGNTLLGAWPGTKADTDTTGLLKATIKTGERDKTFFVQFNDGTNGKQYPSTGGLSGTTGNLYAWENSNNLKPATVVYFGKNYGDSTHAFVQKEDGTVVLEAWPGRQLYRDTSTGLYKLVFGYNDLNTNVYFIVNNGSAGENNQYPWGSQGYMGQTGKMYNFYEDYFETVPQEFNLDTSKYLFNGSLLWYNNKGENGVNVYLDEEGSLIYPQS